MLAPPWATMGVPTQPPPKGTDMTTLKQAKERFSHAQEVALKEGNEFNELIAIGLKELTEALDLELHQLRRKHDDTDRLVRRQS